MNVNIKVSLTDEQRNNMHRRLTGKQTKGMVSRATVNEFMQGCLDSFLTEEAPPKLFGIGSITAQEQMEVDRLRAEGQPDNYIVGWIKGGR